MADGKRIAKLTVSLASPEGEVAVGTLAWSGADRVSAFEYAADFLDRRLEIRRFI